MSVTKGVFGGREVNYDLQPGGRSPGQWDRAAEVPDGLVPTHCCFCGVQCAMDLRVKGGEVVGVEPREFPHSRGNLCPKGVVAYQQALHPERLLHPLMRRGGKGSPLERASWDEVLDHLAARWQEIQQRYGRDAISVYGGSSMTNERCYVVGKFARVALGTRHVDYNGRLCMSSAAAAYGKAFGLDRAPFPLPDIALADCLLVVGSNLAETFPVAIQWLWRARDRGAPLIVVDPRETATARTADLWLPVRPGSDIALLNAMLRQVIHDGRADEEYLRARTEGWDAVRAAVEPYTPERAEGMCGVPAKSIVAAARLYGRAERSIILHARGIEHSTHGVNGCFACINLALARGQVGREGGGVAMITGQGNGQGGREHGQKANQLPGYRHVDHPQDRQFIAEVWGIPVEELPLAGAAATEMVGLMARGEIRSCVVLCSNLMVSLPETDAVEQALARLDPLVVIDFFLSETAKRADVVLPGAIWCEDEGTTTNLEGRVVRYRRATPPRGEARPDWVIFRDLANRLGRGRFFPYLSARDIFEELRAASKGGVADYAGITWEKIDHQQGVFWPCPIEDHPGTPRLFTERFHHPDGRARMFVVEHAPPAEDPGGDFPFRLTTGRVVYHYLSGTQTRRLEFLNSQAPEPWVEVHPKAAADLGIGNGDRVRVRTRRGSMELPALVAPTLRPDTLFIPFHYGESRAVNRLTNPAVEPAVKIPEYKACAARLERLDQPPLQNPRPPRDNLTPASAPKMFPYRNGEGRSPEELEGKVD